jgi:hypothetical protein
MENNQKAAKPFLPVYVELKTDFAQDYHKRFSGQLIGALASIDYFISVKQENKVEAIEWKNRTQNILLGNLSKTKQSTVALISTNEIEGIEPTFPGKKQIEIGMKNPATKTYIEWLQEIDNTVAQIETLWIMGILDSNQRKKALKQISYATMLFTRTARNFINKSQKQDNHQESNEDTQATLEAE